MSFWGRGGWRVHDTDTRVVELRMSVSHDYIAASDTRVFELVMVL